MKRLMLMICMLLSVTAFSQTYKLGDVIKQDNVTVGAIFLIDNSVTGQTTYWVSCGQVIPNRMTYAAAVKYVKTLSYGGYTDWQLPNTYQLTVFKTIFLQNYAQWWNHGIQYSQPNGMPTMTSDVLIWQGYYLYAVYGIGLYSGMAGYLDVNLGLNLIPVRKLTK